MASDTTTVRLAGRPDTRDSWTREQRRALQEAARRMEQPRITRP